MTEDRILNETKVHYFQKLVPSVYVQYHTIYFIPDKIIINIAWNNLKEKNNKDKSDKI